MKKMSKFVSFIITSVLMLSIVGFNALAIEYPTLARLDDGFEKPNNSGQPYENEYGGFISFGGGADEDNFSISSRKSYEGKYSLWFFSREENYNRIKFENFWGSDGLMASNKCTVSFYIYPETFQHVDSTTKLRVGFYDDATYRTKPSYSEEFPVKFDEWNYIEFSFGDSSTAPIIGNIIGIDQPNGCEIICEMHIDNYSYRCYDRYSLGSYSDFDDENYISPQRYTPGGNFKGSVSIDNDAYYGLFGKSVKISGREYKFDRVKFNNVFSVYNNISRNDLGNAYRVSCLVYFDDLYECEPETGLITDTKSDAIKTKLNFGVFAYSDEKNNSGELYLQEFEVYKNTWTQLDFIFIIDDEALEKLVLKISVDQKKNPNDNYPAMKELYIDNLEVELLQDYVALSLTNNNGKFSAYVDTVYEVLKNSTEKCILVCEYDENDILINSKFSEQVYDNACSLYYTPISTKSKVVAYALNNMDDLKPYTFPVEYDQSATVEE